MSPDAATSRQLTPSAPIPVWPRYALPAFATLAALNLIFEAAGPRIGFDLTKPLLMPLLAAALLAQGRPTPPLLLGALLGSTIGDTMLLFGGTWFLVGMAGFAATHLCYITLFGRCGVRRDRRRTMAAGALLYGVVWIVLIDNLLPGVAPGMRIPITGYSLLLIFMGIHAFAGDRRTRIGGALFVLSDSMIAGGLAHWHMPRGTGFAVMATYILGQYLLVSGLMNLSISAGRRPRRPGP
ncbi:lysoplasmalogenase [Actinospica sp. MGRD01-02]|uniref:Lysoplasmalogenase n=1 Tax=Actinospica acidithermotolerans TaxID=2828514 RepID=A0A941EFR6_9ACTN|nr:lysoplasmalogenase [Actinospica acidithermotolerans]MBR7826879.1 lysoplasmalogenase [Actinospica acidithermotolerans]